jgi:fatty-acyl-CoA synthase
MRLANTHGFEDSGEAIGELELRGPQLFGGYFNAPERTAEVMTHDGWLRTGDIVQRAADGVVRICGRQKEMFISGGENVFPGEVEAALLSCRGVAEVAVLGVPDPLWGEVGCAVVVPAPGDAPVPAAEILAEVRSRLAAYKVPRALHFTDTLPRLGSGKIDRRAVASRVRTPFDSAPHVHG